MKDSDLVDARLYYSRAEAVAAVALLREHNIECSVIPPGNEDPAAIATSATPYRLQVPSTNIAKLDRILGDKTAVAPEPRFDPASSQTPDFSGVSPTRIQEGLETIRRARRSFWLAIALLCPVIVLVAGLRGPVSIVAFLAAATYFLVIQWRFLHIPCPRCGKPFHKVRFGYNTLTSECLHCHLPLKKNGAV